MYYDQGSQYKRPKSKKNSFRGNYMRKYGIYFLGGWLLFLVIKEGLVECATVCVKSVVILTYYGGNFL